MKKESESGFFYMWTDDSGKAKETALTMWRRALNARGENRTLPEYYSEGEMNEVSDFISPDIHLDIAIIPPTDERNYYTLCTMEWSESCHFFLYIIYFSFTSTKLSFACVNP